MVSVCVEVEGKIYSTEISLNAYQRLKYCATIKGRAIRFLLKIIVTKHGELTRENILNFLDKKRII